MPVAAAALVITALVLLVIGLGIEFAVYRPLRTAAPLAKLAASLGLLLVAQAAVSLAFGIGTKPQPPVLPGGTVTVFGSNVPIDRFILPGIVLASTLVLSLVLPADEIRAGDAGCLGERSRGDADRASRRTGSRWPARCWGHSSRAPWACSPPRSCSSTPRRSRSRSSRRSPPRSSPGSRRSGSPAWSAWRSGCSRTSSTTSGPELVSDRQVRGRAAGRSSPCFVFLLMVVAMFVRGTSLPSRGELVEQRLPYAPRAKRLWQPALLGDGRGSRRPDRVPLRLPSGPDPVAAGDDHVPLGRRDHRIRRPDLGRAAGARRHLRLHHLPPRHGSRGRLPRG